MVALEAKFASARRAMCSRPTDTEVGSAWRVVIAQCLGLRQSGLGREVPSQPASHELLGALLGSRNLLQLGLHRLLGVVGSGLRVGGLV